MGRPKKSDAQSLASLERDARKMLAETIAALKSQTKQIHSVLGKALKEERLDSKLVRDMTVTQGINVDKTKEILRTLRELESATEEELEAVFDIYEEDPATGKRTLVSRARR